MIGNLTDEPALDRPDLLAPAVLAALHEWPRGKDVRVAEIDPDLADTVEFCARYAVSLDASANCIVVAGKRAGETRYAACLVLATTRADVNNAVRRHLDVRKVSFAAMDDAVERTGMEYGGITPIGAPADWPVLIDSRVVTVPEVVIGSGVRRSKLLVPGDAFAELAGAQVLTDLARENP